jgi:hypothetical protein
LVFVDEEAAVGSLSSLNDYLASMWFICILFFCFARYVFLGLGGVVLPPSIVMPLFDEFRPQSFPV